MKHMKKCSAKAQKAQTQCGQTAKKQCSEAKAPEHKHNPAAAEEIVVIEGVSYTDCCALDPASPCVKNGKCCCKNKKECKDCMKHMKKCSGANAPAADKQQQSN